jgi:DNA-directed RNA polymerase specialized sigma24 family protein
MMVDGGDASSLSTTIYQPISGLRLGRTVHAMHETAAMPDDWPVRPLARARKDGTPYTREPEVEAQVRQLSRLPDRARRERLMTVDRAHPAFVREETLVYCLREYHARGDADAAWQIADLLAQRVASHIRRKLSRWRLSADDRDECARDLFAEICLALFDRGPAAEFWEVRFWVCLDRRLWNLAERRQTAADNELRLADREDGEEEAGVDPLAQVADTRPGPETLAEHRDALRTLTENERLALYLRYVEGWPEESENPDQPSVARVLQVTGRTVRNYLRRAEAKLRAWQQGGEGERGEGNGNSKTRTDG